MILAYSRPAPAQDSVSVQWKYLQSDAINTTEQLQFVFITALPHSCFLVNVSGVIHLVLTSY